jgi:hypothetical protein
MDATSSGAGEAQRRVPAPEGAADDLWPDAEVPEADAQEQQQDAVADGSEPAADPEAPVGGLTGRDLETALANADEADLAEQAREVPYDDDADR